MPSVIWPPAIFSHLHAAAGLSRWVAVCVLRVNPSLRFPFLLSHSAVAAVTLAAGLCFGLGSLQADPPLGDRISGAVAENKIDLRLKALAEVGAHLSTSEIADALARAETLKELRERAVLHDASVKRWSELAPAEAWSYVMKLPEGRGKLDLLRVVVANYATRAPAKAAAALAEMSPGRSKIEATAIVAEVWAKADVPSALAWVRSLPAGPAQEAALYNIRFIWVHSDPVSAADDIQGMQTSDTKRALIMNIAGEWAQRDPAKALAWAKTLSDPAEQGDALFNIAEAWADSHPGEAAEFALQLPSPLRSRASVAVAARWATQDPKKAAEWVVHTEDSDLFSRGLTEVFTVWTAVDPDAAQHWTMALDPAKARDVALQALSDAVVEWAPATATQMALRISDPDQRSTRVINDLDRWFEVDAASARAWLETADLPPETKQTWLSRHEGR